KLPSASDALDNAAAKRTGVVLSNPFLEAELHKTASLERHVKMVNNDAHLQLKNGRKICWNYRKGRCRFGTNCQYAHDSDLSVEEAKTAVTIVTPISSGNKTNASKRKRPGLSDAIEPGKKVMKSYQQQHQMQGSGVR
ncbi:CG42382, partial [Drosophila busckii]